MSKGPIRLFGYARVSTEDEATDAQFHKRIDRTGVGTRALFGATLRFDLSHGTVPILTVTSLGVQH